MTERITRETGQALSGCYPGSTLNESETSEGISVGFTVGNGRPSFSVRGNRRLSVVLDISLWKPG